MKEVSLKLKLKTSKASPNAISSPESAAGLSPCNLQELATKQDSGQEVRRASRSALPENSLDSLTRDTSRLSSSASLASAALQSSLGEQVAPAIAKSWMCDLQTHLERENYAVGFAVLPACSVGAPHKRERLFFGAHELADAASTRHLRCASTASETGWKPEYESAGKLSTRPGGHTVSPIQQSAGMGGVAKSLRAEWHGERLQRPGEGYQAQGSRTSAEPTGCGYSDELAYSSQCGRGKERENVRRGIVGDSEEGWSTGRSASGCDNATNPIHGFWSDADWLGCRDGKFRPVESGTFPLANGVPARVGRLRGYGNAIVPQVAAEFITAFMGAAGETLKD